MADKIIRHLRLIGATGTIRTAMHEEREHLVVPVVAMVEGVVWAVNSEVPEFVPADELAQTPQQWNGRRCFAGHPADGGTQVTANTPRTLEQSFGVIFDAASSERILQTRRLELEAWLDPAKAEKVGPEAVDVIRRLRAGERVEVSVGAYVEPDDSDGTFNGKEYHGIWRNIVSDHLAFLAPDQEGACSIEAGCGAPRTAVRHLVTAAGIKRDAVRVKLIPLHVQALTGWDESGQGWQRVDVTFTDGTMASGVKVYNGEELELADEFQAKAIATIGPHVAGQREASMAVSAIKKRFDLLTAEGVSDSDVRRALEKVLQVVDGYMGIDCVYPDEQQVVYYVSTRDMWKMKRRSYSMTEGGEATLADDAVEVEPVTTYEPITAAEGMKPKAAKLNAAAPCGCKEKKVMVLDKTKRAEMAAALVADPHSGFKEGDETFLNSEAISDDRLEAFQAAATSRKAEAEKLAKLETDHRAAAAKVTVLEGKLKVAEQAPTHEEWLAKAPAGIKTLLEQQAAAEAEEHATLVASLKACGVKTEDELKATKIDELRTLAKFAKVERTDRVADFSGRGAPRVAAAAGDKDAYAPPDPYAAGIAALQGSKAVN